MAEPNEQAQLFWQATMEHATRDQLVQRRRHAAIPHEILADPTLTPAAKLVYAALLDHLWGESDTYVWPSPERLGELTGLSRSAVFLALAELDTARRIERQRRHRRAANVAFSPLRGMPGDGADDTAQTPDADGNVCGNLSPKSGLKPAVLSPKSGLKEDICGNLSPKSGLRRELREEEERGAAQALRQESPQAARPGSGEGTKPEAEKPAGQQRYAAMDRRPQVVVERTVDLAAEWAELLGLDRLARSDQQEWNDAEDLQAVAVAMLDGDLGEPVEVVEQQLRTAAHQIGNRTPAARSPLGLFLREHVGLMRNRCIRRKLARTGQAAGRRT